MPTTVNVNEAGYDLDVGGSTGSLTTGSIIVGTFMATSATASYVNSDDGLRVRNAAGALNTGRIVFGTGAARDLYLNNTASSHISINQRGELGVGNDGIWRLASWNAATVQLCFQGLTSSYPSLKQSGSELQVRLGDDSNYATMAVGSLKQQIASGASDPTSSNFASGLGGWFKNTTANEIRFWYNDSGTLKKSAALT